MPDDTSPLQLPSVHGARLLNRRGFLGHATTGLGSIALASLLQEQGLLSADESLGTDGPNIDLKQPYVARPGHFKPAARNVLVIQCVGALSQIDTFDYKPELYKLDGQPLPGHEKLVSFQGENGNVVRPLWEFKPRGQCGKMISELTPHIAELADEMCFIHSLTSKSNAHGPGESFMSTGFTADGFPGMGRGSPTRSVRRTRTCRLSLPLRTRVACRRRVLTTGTQDFCLPRFRERRSAPRNRFVT